MRSSSNQPPTRSSRLLLALIFSVGLAACGSESSEALVEKAQQSLAGGDRSAAIIHLKSAIQENEKNAEARFQLGKLYLEMGDFASAEKEFVRAREAGYDANMLNPPLAKAFIGQGEFKRVLDDLPLPGPGNPTAVPMQVVRAHAQISLGDREAARTSLEQALDAAPNNADVRLALARLALADGDADKAGKQIDEALRLDPKFLDGWLFKGELLRSFGKHSDAAKAYRAALKLDPAHDGARLALASIAIADNRLADARSEANAVLKTSRNNLQARYTLALIDFREKKYEAARDQLATVLKFAPDYPPAVLLAGSVEYALGNMQTAEMQFNKAVKASPRNLYALRLLAAAQVRQGRPDEATRTLAGVPDDLKDAGFQVVAGEIALAKKNFAKAAEHFELAARISPENPAIRTELGLARLAEGDPRAMADLQTAAGMEGSPGRADMVIILNQLRQKKYDAALASIDALEKKQGASPLTWNYRGAAQLGKQDLDKARASFSQALKLDPAFFPAAANLAQLHLRNKQPAAARKLFEATLKADPTNLHAMMALAELSLHEQDEKGYVSWLEKASRTHPKALPPRIAMVRHLLTQGEKNKAVAVAREAVDANPDHPAALELLGNTQLSTGDTLNAVTTFTTLTKKQPQSADAYRHLAMAQLANRQQADARASLNRAIQLKPGHLQSLDALSRLELAENKLPAALDVARQMQTLHPRSPLGFEREGDIQLAQKRLPQAIQAYEQALEKGAGSAELIKLHRMYLQAGNTEAAEQRLANWLKQHPDHHAVRAYAANHYMASGRNQDAIAQYQMLLRQTPANVLVLNNLASLYQREKDNRAQATAEQALKLAPNNPAVQDTLGWILVEGGQTRRGQELLRKALAGAPRHPSIRYHHAVALARLGNKAQARRELEKLLADTPTFAEAAAAHALLKNL